MEFGFPTCKNKDHPIHKVFHTIIMQKPDKNAYKFAINSLLVPSKDICVVSSHVWDVFGALQNGMQAVYVQRDKHQPWPAFLDSPTHIVSSFDEMVDRILGM